MLSPFRRRPRPIGKAVAARGYFLWEAGPALAKSLPMDCAFTVEDVRARHRRTLVSLGRYRRLSDFVSSALTFLRSNMLLRGMLTAGDLRDAPADTWLGTPAMSVLFAHLNRLHRDHDGDMILVTCAPAAPIARVANLWLEGGTAPRFGNCGGGLSYLAQKLDGVMRGAKSYNQETSEEAFGRAVDLAESVSGTVVCAVDVEGSASFFLDAAADSIRARGGAVLPILLRQGRLGARPGYASMDDEALAAAARHAGFAVRTVETGLQFEARMYTTLEWAWHRMRGGEASGASDEEGHPIIVVKIPRGLTLPIPLAMLLDRAPDDFLDALRGDEKLLDAFRTWLESYVPDELVEIDGCPDKDILALCAPPERRVARSLGNCTES